MQAVFIDRLGMQHGDPVATGIFSHISLAPNGRELAIQRATADGLSESWTFAADRHTQERIATGKTFPVWSRDGGRIVMLTADRGLFGLQHRTRDGADQSRILLESKEDKIPLDWAPGNQWILYQKSGDHEKFDLLLARADGSRPGIPYIHSAANETDGQFSPDGRWLAYVSDESGAQEVYVQRFLGAESPPGPRWQISESGGAKPRWRRDGKELFFVDPQHRFMGCEVVKSDLAFEHRLAKPLFPTRLASSMLGQQYDPMPDSKGFLMLLPAGSERLPLTVLMNWSGASRPITSMPKGRQ
jgi:eukaryotic-like serine/threonine-protein kinase